MWQWNETEQGGQPHFTAEAALHYFLGSRGLTLDDLRVHPVVVAAFQPFTHRLIVKQTGAVPATPWVEPQRAPLSHGAVDGVPISVILLPVGAPWTVLLCEELIAAGARAIVAVGAAGSLQASAPIGSLVVPTAAIREEGTSYHYAPAGAEAMPSPRLAEALAGACRERGIEPARGVNWTTDAPFREMGPKVERFRAAGVISVDMEASAMFVLGAVRGVAVASLFIVSDELFHPWRPAFSSQEYLARVRVAADAALATAGRWAAASMTAG